MKNRRLGGSGATVSAIGLGCMGMSIAYGPVDTAEARRTLDRAGELGITFLDTADAYGRGANEELLGNWLQGRARESFFLATKFGLRHDPVSGRVDRVDNSPEHTKKACDASLRRLGVDHIDLYYVHRRTPDIPVEETVGAMAELVAAGKVRFLGLSEVSPGTLRDAHAVHPVSAVQMEYSLATRDVVEGDMLATCRELGTAVVAYSPLGRGMLAGAVASRDELSEGDNRRRWPRFSEENIGRNLALVRALEAVAGEIGCTPAQAALGWLLAQGDDIIPIPGTKRLARLEENAAAVDLVMTPEQLARIGDAVPAEAVAGARYPEQALSRLGH
ncbi:aldo/keto reductase [Streptomyces sp. NRRL B-1677]|uniref:aldo/keto reductase n=1 Tax=Streptomyces sp. NRRL B-1677 TaxID=2682966 RepID=UPI001892A338|nr:aldo/keto reductase [Streptomyces sp. NRRL B-1677]MBF6049208.1 aldo/keto reductase [Streptomyces sp. NRRL B-1677]